MCVYELGLVWTVRPACCAPSASWPSPVASSTTGLSAKPWRPSYCKFFGYLSISIYLSIYINLSIYLYQFIYLFISIYLSLYINLSFYLYIAIFVEQCSQPWSPACRGVSCTCWPTGSAWRTSQPPAFSLVTRILAQESKPESKAEFLSHFRFLHLNFAYFLWKTSQKSLSVKIINIVTGSVDEMMAVNLYGRLFQPHGMGHFIG